MKAKVKKATPVKNATPVVAILDTEASSEYSSIEQVFQASRVHVWTQAKLGLMLKRHMNHLLKVAKRLQNNECESCAMAFDLESNNVMMRYGLIVHRECQRRWRRSPTTKRILKALKHHDKAVRKAIM